MKAKEKAKELVLAFRPYVYEYYIPEEYIISKCKESALISVDEIINSSPMYYNGFEYESNLEYWIEVRKEIENIGDNYIVW
jgi:hypothetical protein